MYSSTSLRTGPLIDTHAHLDDIENLDPAIARAREGGLIAIIAIGVDYESNNRVLEIAERYRSLVFPALGCHPGELRAAETERNLQFIEDNVERAVGIGEIGLDYHKRVTSKASKDTQKQVLKDVLSIAKRYAKPALIHSRYSWRDCLALVQELGVERAVFHWYSGPMSVLHDLIRQGFFASATLAAEYHEGHRRAISETPCDNLLLETDSPVVYRWGTELAHPSEPADVTRVLEAVAKLKGVERGVVAQRTTENALTLFGLSNQLFPIPTHE
ncbi:MAG: TatD family hydrolase [Dehalococcoidia bacterium]|nr:D-aminoacyl-tRNA deacylase [Chloroflexota bacterium]MBT9160808.1 D-aminoacyl-tRNA deacylase [Chloroflexota bacterium]MBT9162948.1 D-aminoacyl-tRNA deacylase [Chloroflexota bacterium]